MKNTFQCQSIYVLLIMTLGQLGWPSLKPFLYSTIDDINKNEKEKKIKLIS